MQASSFPHGWKRTCFSSIPLIFCSVLEVHHSLRCCDWWTDCGSCGCCLPLFPHQFVCVCGCIWERKSKRSLLFGANGAAVLSCSNNALLVGHLCSCKTLCVNSCMCLFSSVLGSPVLCLLPSMSPIPSLLPVSLPTPWSVPTCVPQREEGPASQLPPRPGYQPCCPQCRWPMERVNGVRPERRETEKVRHPWMREEKDNNSCCSLNPGCLLCISNVWRL